jgi:diguanylate cyclase (GGDEF)-like protein/PAS domain S-box-containing protein
VRSAGWRDCLAVPVLCDDARVGVLAVYDRTGLAELDSADLTVLQALAQELAAALQRADLIDQALRARDSAARIIAGSNDGIVALAADATVVAWNPALAEITGRSAEEMIGASIADLDLRDSSGRPVALHRWPDGGPLPGELQIRAVDGSARWVSCSYAQDTDRWRGGQMLVVMVRDVTELRRQRALVAGQAQILELIAADQPPETSLRAIARLVAAEFDGAIVGIVTSQNHSGGAALAVTEPPSPDEAAFSAELVAAADVCGPQLADGRPHVLDVRCCGADGPCWVMPVPKDEHSRARAVLVVRPHGAAALDDHAEQVLRTAARLTDVCLSREEARARLAHQASHDALTGLPNRALFLDRCSDALRAVEDGAPPVVLLFVDLDEFKVVNDSLGHDVGDRLLVAVAERLRHAVRPSDTIARFGGDEFTILCPGVREEGARMLAERVLALFDSPFHVGEVEVFETASVGIAVGDRSSRPSDLLQQADAAMYGAKDGGGNRYFFFESGIGRHLDARLASYTALRRAVDECQFQVHYQPIVSISDGSLAGMEALVRWEHPSGSLLPPQDFIDLAEDTGLIVPLGAFVLRTAVLDLPRLSLHGAQPSRISVNVSARQLTSPHFLETVRHALKESDVAPERLFLEITESVLLTRSSAVYGVIDELKSLGVGLSLDDFGTGHSSLDYLRHVPVNELKIDRRFIADLLTSRESRAIVSAVIRLARDLGLQVVAEGIEGAEQAACLAELGCDLAQGYYYSPPLPAGEVVAEKPVAVAGGRSHH